MWLWVLSIIILLGFSGALMWRYEKRLSGNEDIYTNYKNGAENEIESLNEDISQKNNTISRNRTKIGTLLNEKKRLDAEIMSLNEKINTYTEKISGLERETETLKKTVSEHDATIEGQKKTIADCKTELADRSRTMKKLKAEHAKMASALKKAQEQVKINFAQMSAAMSERNTLKKKIEDYEKNVIPDLKKQIEELKEE